MTNTFSIITNEKAFGGRLGLWWPEVGLEVGLSGLYNGDYVAGGFEDSISLLGRGPQLPQGQLGRSGRIRHVTSMPSQSLERSGLRQHITPPGLLCPGRLPAAGLPQQVLAEHRVGLPV